MAVGAGGGSGGGIGSSVEVEERFQALAIPRSRNAAACSARQAAGLFLEERLVRARAGPARRGWSVVLVSSPGLQEGMNGHQPRVGRGCLGASCTAEFEGTIGVQKACARSGGRSGVPSTFNVHRTAERDARGWPARASRSSRKPARFTNDMPPGTALVMRRRRFSTTRRSSGRSVRGVPHPALNIARFPAGGRVSKTNKELALGPSGSDVGREDDVKSGCRRQRVGVIMAV